MPRPVQTGAALALTLAALAAAPAGAQDTGYDPIPGVVAAPAAPPPVPVPSDPAGAPEPSSLPERAAESMQAEPGAVLGDLQDDGSARVVTVKALPTTATATASSGTASGRGQAAPAAASPAQPVAASSLPFTGVDLLLLALGGALLVAIGAILLVVTRRTEAG